MHALIVIITDNLLKKLDVQHIRCNNINNKLALQCQMKGKRSEEIINLKWEQFFSLLPKIIYFLNNR